MDNNKIETISNLFEDKEIRSVWDSEKEEYFFSVVDVISALTDSNIPRNYWSDLKRKLKSEGSELHENIVQLKMKAQDGKMRETDTLDTKGILKLISINDNIDGLNDEEDITTTIDLCEENNLGIEIQGFYNPYIDNKNELKLKYLEELKRIHKGKSYHAPFWDLNLGTKIIELQNAMFKIYNEAYYIAKELGCTEMVIHSNYKPGTD